MRRGKLATLILLAALAGRAAAHTIAPAAVVAELNAEKHRTARGIQRAEQSAENPRLLVIHVAPGWYGIDVPTRIALAGLWRDRWRHSVEQGVIAVLDGRTDEPVIEVGAGGVVAGVRQTPTR